MHVYLWRNFSKRRNSTLRPTNGTYDYDATCRLKENTSVQNPVIILAKTANFNNQYKYAWIVDFAARFYYVKDIVSTTDGTIEVHLEIDVLASWYSDIANTFAYVKYASIGYNSSIPDTRIPLTDNRTIYYRYMKLPHLTPAFDEKGAYVLTTYNCVQGATHIGVNSVYLIRGDDATAMEGIRSFLDNNSIMGSLRTYLNGEPLNAITGLIWIPIRPTVGQSEEAELGPADANLTSAFCIGDQSLAWSGDQPICVLKRPAVVTRSWAMDLSDTTDLPEVYGDFRKNPPYHTVTIYLPGVGTVPINVADWYNNGTFEVKMSFEIITGNVLYSILRNGNELVQQFSGNVASQIPLGQMTSNAVQGTLQTIGSVMSGNVVGVMSGVLNAFSDHATASGQFGSRASTVYPYIVVTHYIAKMAQDPDDVQYIARYGRPVEKVVQLYTLDGGYVQCENASVSCQGTAQETQEINNFLNSGFYLE